MKGPYVKKFVKVVGLGTWAVSEGRNIRSVGHSRIRMCRNQGQKAVGWLWPLCGTKTVVLLPSGESLCFPHDSQGAENQSHCSPSTVFPWPFLKISQVSSYEPQTSAHFHLLPPAGVGETPFTAMAGHQDPVTCFPVSAKLRRSLRENSSVWQLCTSLSTKTFCLWQCQVRGDEAYREEPMGAFECASPAKAREANQKLNHWNSFLACCRFVVLRAEIEV